MKGYLKAEKYLKHFFLFLFFQMAILSQISGQEMEMKDKASQKIHFLIDQYSEARDKKDTVLLKAILTQDIDQLVSSGEWRIGIGEAVLGMMRSSIANPGDRTLIIEKIRFVKPEAAIVDARYEIKNPDGSLRKMWSTFFVVFEDENWKITSIRNMVPAGQ